jgi:hypothetical protein
MFVKRLLLRFRFVRRRRTRLWLVTGLRLRFE